MAVSYYHINIAGDEPPNPDDSSEPSGLRFPWGFGVVEFVSSRAFLTPSPEEQEDACRAHKKRSHSADDVCGYSQG